MHRWFFANDEIFCETPKPLTTSPSQISATSSVLSAPAANWSFRVQCNWQLCLNEFLAISGSCPSLGNWDVQAAVPLTRDCNTSFWTLTVVLPRDCDICYRYFVCAVDVKGRKFVRFWETHFGGRLISQNQSQNVNSREYEIFGLLKNELKIKRGWLQPFVTVVQLKFYQAPFVLNSSREILMLQVKVTPVKLKTCTKCNSSQDAVNKSKIDEHNSEATLAATFAFCEVASLQDQKGEFCKQPKYGTPCGPHHWLMFNITVNVLEECAFLIDLYDVTARCGQDVPPNHFGYQYIMPRDLVNSAGKLELAIICGTRHRPIGSFKCDYLIVKPMKPFHKFNLKQSFQNYWNPKNRGLYCGHRGCGRSFWLQNNIVRENCLKSFNLVIEHGADMIEFDTQLTKDAIPIVYHDSELFISKNFDINLWENDIIHMPLTQREMKELRTSAVKLDKELSVVPLATFSLEQLSRAKVYEPSPAEMPKTACSSDAKDNRPFITLEQVLRAIKLKIGFVIDIKWPQNFTYGDREISLVNNFDQNEYIDAILSVVIKNAGSRRIIFTSCDADVCTMVQLKQNLYPIMFQSKTNGDTLCMNPEKTISSGIYFACAMELGGISINCASISHIPGNVTGLHERGLFVFAWGVGTRYEHMRKQLKKLGIDGIICDRLNHVLKPLDLRKDYIYIVPWKNEMENINSAI